MSNSVSSKKPVLITLGIFVSRILAFIRDILLAYWLGASYRLDAFLIAFKVPNLARRLFTEGVLAQVIIPSFKPYQDDLDKLRACLWQALTQVFIWGLLGLILAELLAPTLIRLLAPGFMHQPDVFILASLLLRLTLPVIWFIALTSLCSTALRLVGAYTTIAITPAFINVVLVAVLIAWVPHIANPLLWLAFSLSIAGLLQLLLQIPALIRYGLWWQRGQSHLQITKTLIPPWGFRLLALVSGQLGIVIIMAIASFLPAGSISTIYFIDRLTAFPMALIGAVIAFIAVPNWSHSTSQASINIPFSEYWPNLAWTLRLGIPASVGLWIMSNVIWYSLFSGAAFSAATWPLLVSGLKILALAITPWLLIKVLASLDFAEGNARDAGLMALMALVVTLVAGSFSVYHHALLGIIASLSVAAYLNAFGLLWLRMRKQIHLWLQQLAKELVVVLPASIMMGLFLLWLLPHLTLQGLDDTLSVKLLTLTKLFGIILLAAGIYAAVGWGVSTIVHKRNTLLT